MSTNKDIFFICPDLGYPRTDEIEHKYPDRFIWTGASESVAMDICVGLALSNKIPVIYTITPFFYRGFETIRLFLNHEKLHVVMIGAGVKEEYGELDGWSHSASDIKDIFSTQKNIVQYYPETVEVMQQFLSTAIKHNEPSFINIHK